MLARDSPSLLLRLLVAPPNAFNTCSLSAAVTCSCASESPVWQLTESTPITYWLPRLAIEPAMYALLPARWQRSRARSGVSFVPAGLAISLSVARVLVSDRIFKNGD